MHLLDGDVGSAVLLDFAAAEFDHFCEGGTRGFDAGGEEEGDAVEEFLPLFPAEEDFGYVALEGGVEGSVSQLVRGLVGELVEALAVQHPLRGHEVLDRDEAADQLAGAHELLHHEVRRLRG